MIVSTLLHTVSRGFFAHNIAHLNSTCLILAALTVTLCLDLLLSLKILGFLDSRVCRSTGMSPSGSSFPKLSFNSLETKKTMSDNREQTQLFGLYRNNLRS